jgi:hypothetical protein
VRNLVAFLAALGLVGFVGVAAHGVLPRAHPAPAPIAAPAPAPLPTIDAVPTVPVLQQIPIPTPPVVTGLPYPAKCTAQGKLPDPACTPGSVNPAVTQATIHDTICKPGWTATVRPPASNTGPVKKAAMKAYGLASSSSGTTELDHLVPLELGASDDVTNLWPEPSDIPNDGFRNTKDTVENRLRAAVCDGSVTLPAAQAAIAADWTTAEQKLGVN